ncbi:hypothetical protein ZYGR_0AI06240 [Zygosaccharomyces rouxii]|uniref:Ribosome biogenesis protein NSA1 n=1 Tax=Zygosaccharomyces rouxii TaxID=4956 RepID=A0A1Q3ACI8_ZYGRO|nr:hypothetical protein ZYGR_0AI06240 [Zygosaccharomyces rouxii]
MRLLISCFDGGSLKEVVCGVGTDSSVQTALQPLKLESINSEGTGNCVDIMHSLGDKFLLGRRNGIVELVHFVEEYELKDKVTDLLDDSRLEPFYAKSKSRVKLRDTFVMLQPLKNGHFLAVTKSGLVHVLKLNQDEDKIVKLKTWEIKAPLDFAQLCDNWDEQNSGSYVFGYGGEENQIKLVEIDADFDNLKQIWKAKNVKNDRLDMRVPVWPTAMKFLQPSKSDTADKSKLNFQFVVITRWSHLAHYSTQYGRRPIIYKQLFENREPLEQLEIDDDSITSLGNISTDKFQDFALITTDTRKNVYKYDISGRLLAKLGNGDISGAVSFVKKVEPGYILQGGLDRYARVFDASTGERLVKIYTGGSINCMVLLDGDRLDPVEREKREAKRKPVDDEEDAEKLWEQLSKKPKKAKK